MKQACLKEIDRFCKDVPHGQARVIRCLQVRLTKPCRVQTTAGPAQLTFSHTADAGPTSLDPHHCIAGMHRFSTQELHSVGAI
jgi:hypothetical protein